MKIHFSTFGCKVNLYETENMKQVLSANGFKLSNNPLNCDIYIVNSCAVTKTSVQKTHKEIRRLKRENPDAVIVLTGCYPQAYEDEASVIPEADIITGTKNRSQLPGLIKNYMDNKDRIVNICSFTDNEMFEPMHNTGYENKTRAFVKIQDGCSMHCSYCIIPYSRGKFRSKPLHDLICEAENLAGSGYKEIVLTGINLSFYGTESGLRLADAVEAVCGIKGIERVRLGSLEPEMITDGDIERLSKQPKLCPQFHFSLQSGSDKILKAMNRRYSCADYEALVSKLRCYFDNCAVTTDIMVGFPGESDNDFNTTKEFIRKIGFSQAHIFPYSKRKNTPAAVMDNQIPDNIKHLRAKELKILTGSLTEQFMQKQVGLTVPVLFEKEKSDEVPYGYSPNYTLIKILKNNYDKSLRNMIFYVKIIKADGDYCIGELIVP